MTLRELAKEIQPYVGDNGTCNIAVWKEGRSWRYADLWGMEDNDPDDLAEWEQAKAADPKAILLSAYENFANNRLDYIAYQVNKIYTKR